MRRLPDVNDILADVRKTVESSKQEKVASEPTPGSEFTTKLAVGIHKLASRLREVAADTKPSFEAVQQLGDRILSSSKE